MTRFHDVPFVIEPVDALCAAERGVLEGMSRPCGALPARDPFHLRVESGEAPLPQDVPPDSRADIRWNDERITVRHETFEAELWPLERRGTLRRRSSSSFPLQLTVETAACSTLPYDGAIVLHAACVEVDGIACVFFGPSGIGKSTLASRSPFPVMSEELVAIRSRPEVMAHSGEGGADAQRGCRGARRVAALFELGRADAIEITRLERNEAARSLLGSTLVYPIASSWSHALRIVNEIVTAIPVHRFAWSLQDTAWSAIERIARGDGR